MLRRVTVGFAVIVFALSFAGCTTEWREIRPVGARCVVALPEPIKESGSGADTSLGHLAFPGNAGHVIYRPRALFGSADYGIFYADASKFTAAQRDVLVRELRDSEVAFYAKHLKGKLIGEQPYSTAGCHGVTIEMRTPDADRVLERICVSEERAYILSATEPADHKWLQSSDRFFNSFHIESPTATVTPSP